jgi:hypothetical protein
MKLFHQLDEFLLTSRAGRTLFGPVVSTGAAVLLGLSFDRQPLSVQLVRLTLLVLVLSATWYGVRRSELERAASEARSTDLEDRLRDLILTTRNQSVAAAERAEEAAVGALRSSLCGLEAQAASADLATATTARSYLALLEREGLTVAVPDGEPRAQER